MSNVFSLLLAREARLLFRRPAELANPLVFFAIVIALFPLAVGPESQLLQTLSPGLVWVAALLAVLLSLEGLFRSDFEDGSLEQWVLSPHPLALLVLAKVLAHWLFSGLALVLMSPLFALMLGLPARCIPVLLLSLLLGTPVLSLLGAVGAALKVIRRAEPEAVILVGTYGPCAEFIKMSHRSGFNPTFTAVSFVGANALAKELGAEGRGVIVSEVVLFPWDTDRRVVSDYQAAMKSLDPSQTPDFIGLEGYITGRLVARALAMTGPNPTRADLLRIINEVGQFDIGGLVVNFGSARKDNPPQVTLTVIQSDGSFKPI